MEVRVVHSSGKPKRKKQRKEPGGYNNEGGWVRGGGLDAANKPYKLLHQLLKTAPELEIVSKALGGCEGIKAYCASGEPETTGCTPSFYIQQFNQMFPLYQNIIRSFDLRFTHVKESERINKLKESGTLLNKEPDELTKTFTANAVIKSSTMRTKEFILRRTEHPTAFDSIKLHKLGENAYITFKLKQIDYYYVLDSMKLWENLKEHFWKECTYRMFKTFELDSTLLNKLSHKRVRYIDGLRTADGVKVETEKKRIYKGRVVLTMKDAVRVLTEHYKLIDISYDNLFIDVDDEIAAKIRRWNDNVVNKDKVTEVDGENRWTPLNMRSMKDLDPDDSYGVKYYLSRWGEQNLINLFKVPYDGRRMIHPVIEDDLKNTRVSTDVNQIIN